MIAHLTCVVLLGQAQPTDSSMEAMVQQWIQALTTPLAFVILGAGFFGLFMGWLFGRTGASPAPQPEPQPEKSKAGGEELQWRHEKLVLLERQESERQLRFEQFLEAMGETRMGQSGQVKAGLFRLAETMRDLRQRVGTDFSRLSLVDERLEELNAEGSPRPEAVEACREIARSQILRLKDVREKLRPVSLEICELEESFLPNESLSEEARKALLDKVTGIQSSLADLPTDWHVLADEADRKIRDLLGAGKEPEYEAIRDVLLIDGSVSVSLENSRNSSPLSIASDLMEVLEVEEKEADEEPDAESAEKEGSEYPLAVTPLAMKPDKGFRPPENGTHVVSNGNGIRKTEGIERTSIEESIDPGEESSAEAKPETGSLVLFRSNDVEIWGKDVYRGSNARARALTELPDWAGFISIRRMDTGEAVYAPTEFFSWSNADLAVPIGFNGSNELFYGARHLGMFSEAVPNEVETRFTYGGWGFGHRVEESVSTSSELQASGWEGREISSDTVFEIVIYRELPELEEKDQLLDPRATLTASVE